MKSGTDADTGDVVVTDTSGNGLVNAGTPLTLVGSSAQTISGPGLIGRLKVANRRGFFSWSLMSSALGGRGRRSFKKGLEDV